MSTTNHLMAIAVVSCTAFGTFVMPASAATIDYTELVYEGNQLDLVMTARDTFDGASVGLATDNDNRSGQWRRNVEGVVGVPGVNSAFVFILRDTYNTSQQLCLTATGLDDVRLARCVGSNNQKWHYDVPGVSGENRPYYNIGTGKFFGPGPGGFNASLKQFNSPGQHLWRKKTVRVRS